MDTLGKKLHVNFLGYEHWFISIRISLMKNHYIPVDHARYSTSIVAKYLDNDTVKTSIKFYNTTFPSDMIFTKTDAYTSDDKVDKLTREFNIHYRDCIELLIYLLSTRVDFSFAVHKLTKLLSNPGEVHFEILVHLLRYIKYYKTLCLNYYYYMKDAPLSDTLRQTIINTENQLVAFYDYSWKYCPDTFRSTEAYMIFYKVFPIVHGTHIPLPVLNQTHKVSTM